MAKAISNKNVLNAKFETANFTGKWLASFGKPELRGAWIIYGESGTGKTHFALELLKYVSQFVDKAAYDTLEQGLSLSFQNAWRDANMQEVGSKVVVLGKETISDLRTRLVKRKSPSVVVIDSITALVGFTRSVFIELINDFPDKLFIFIAHEENRKPYPVIAQHVRKLSEVKIHVEGYKAFITTRFNCGNGEGGADYVIWEQGANEYWVDKF
ncbi:MAG: ATP-binding protein [Alistipes sp.]